MVLAIFFGGILLGFLTGFIFMALLAAANYHPRAVQVTEVPVYHRLRASRGHRGARYRSRD
jgi:hypothetical protein